LDEVLGYFHGRQANWGDIERLRVELEEEYKILLVDTSDHSL
jgi:hypothetical protein